MSKATKESVTRAMNRVGIPGTIFYDTSVRNWYAVDALDTQAGQEFWCMRSEGTDIFPSLNGLTTEQALGYVIDRAFCRDPEDDPKGFDEEICTLLIAVYYPSLVPAGWTDQWTRAAILNDMQFDECRGWIRRKIKAGRSWAEVRRFLRPTWKQAEARLKEAIEDGDIDSLDDIKGDSLLARWARVVKVIEENDRKNTGEQK